MTMSMKDKTETFCSRREFLAAALAAPLVLNEVSYGVAADEVVVASPNKQIQFYLSSRSAPGLRYRISFKNKPVIETAQLGIVIDGTDLGQGAEIGKVENYRLKEKYLSRGVHSEAANDCRGTRLAVKHKPTNTDCTLEIRVFDDGVAFRYIVPGNSRERKIARAG
jgi:alpha-glucosidase